MITLLALVALLQLVADKSPLCDGEQGALALKVNHTCSLPWSKVKAILRPTQNSIDYAWVQRSTEKDMGTEKGAQAAIDDKLVPIVRGPGGKAIYAIDAHHTLASLDFSGFHSVRVTLTMMCDYSADTEATYWKRMANQGFAYLYGRKSKDPNALPSPILPSELPSSFSFSKKGTSFQDDRWRAMTGFSRKIRTKGDSKYTSRCMNRVCDARTGGGGFYFFEYRWGFFFAAHFQNSSAWDDKSAFSKFNAAYSQLPAAAPGGADISAWQATADDLLPLCRGTSAGEFSIPASYGIFSGKLPGYVKGLGPISPAKDSDCKAPVCPG